MPQKQCVFFCCPTFCAVLQSLAIVLAYHFTQRNIFLRKNAHFVFNFQLSLEILLLLSVFHIILSFLLIFLFSLWFDIDIFLSKDFMMHFAFLFFHFRIHLFPVQRRLHLSRFDVSRFLRFPNKQAHFSFPGRYDRVCPILLFCSSHFQAGLLDPQGKVFIDIFLCRKYNVHTVLISITKEVCYDS